MNTTAMRLPVRTPGSVRRNLMRHWPLYIMLMIPLAYIIAFAYVPMGGILMAFQDYRPTRGLLGSKWVGLKHFVKFLSMPAFFQLLRNTVTISLYSLVAGFPMPILLAFTLNVWAADDSKRQYRWSPMRPISSPPWLWWAC
jgi:ABC-type polysaccharide transport system permease subunit